MGEHEVVMKYLQEASRLKMSTGTQIKDLGTQNKNRLTVIKDQQVIKSQDHPMVKIHDQLGVKTQDFLAVNQATNGVSESNERSGKISPVLRFSKETVYDEEKKNNESEEESDEEIEKILKSRQKDTNVNSEP